MWWKYTYDHSWGKNSILSVTNWKSALITHWDGLDGLTYYFKIFEYKWSVIYLKL